MDTEVANIEQRTACAILGSTEGIQDVNLQRADIAAPVFGHVRAVQLLLGHTKIESTVRYLGIEVDDALAIAEQVDV
jgi:hypothetical protein